MSYTLKKNLTTVNYTKGNSGRKYIVIHYTGNTTDTAANNASYFKSVDRGASAHYFVDKTQVVQVVDDSNTAWSVGVNYGSGNLFGKCTNANSLNIEMCSTGGKIADETYENTVELTKTLMKKYSISASNVVRHWDVCSKACPGWTGWGANGKDSSIWTQFKKDIQSSSSSSGTSSSSSSSSSSNSSSSSSSSSSTTTVSYKVKINTTSGVNMRKGAGTSYSKITAIPNGKTVTITKESGSWGYTTYNSKSGWICLDYTKKVTSSSSSSSSSSVSYTKGKTYTLQVDKLTVRSGAGTNYSAKSYSQLTANAKKNAYSNGTLKKGTKVTCQATKTVSGNVWMQIPSGWIAAYYNKKYYVK